MVRRVRRIIGQLFSVLSLVRRPTSLGANEKVLNYDFASKLGHDYQELLGTLPDYLDSWLKQNFKSVSDSQQCTLPQFLFDRLKQAAIFRRKAWLLRSRHKRKLHGDVAARFDRVPFRQTITIQQNPASVASHDRADAKTIARGEAGSKILSGTVPSITPEQIRLRQTKVTAQPTPKSSKSVIQQRGRLDVPFPPKRAAPAMEFDCYICGLTLDKVEAQEDRWKKHVLNDIAPFICLFQCGKPDVLYTTADEWYRHIQEHRMEWCCMTPAHRHLVFETAEELSIHLESDHASSLSQAQRNLLLKRGVRALPSIFDDCPLCGKTAHEIQADEDSRRSSPTLLMEDQVRSKLINRHIESHMYEIALLSVPPYPDLVAMSQSAAVNEGSETNRGESFEERLIEEGLLQLPNDVEDQDPLTTPIIQMDRDLEIAQTKGQIPAMFFSDEEEEATTWAAFVDSQHEAPDIFSNEHDWNELCRILADRKGERDEAAKQTSEMRPLETLHSFAEAKQSSPADARLYFVVAESMCTNRHVCKAVKGLIDPVDITIAPPDASGLRHCSLYLSSYKEAAVAWTKMNEFEISDKSISCTLPLQADLSTALGKIQATRREFFTRGYPQIQDMMQSVGVSLEDRVAVSEGVRAIIAKSVWEPCNSLKFDTSDIFDTFDREAAMAVQEQFYLEAQKILEELENMVGVDQVSRAPDDKDKYESADHRRCHMALKVASKTIGKDLIEDPFPGTCDWLLDHPKFCNWKENGTNSILRITGSPGSGKSVLAKATVDHLVATEQCTCYYFFSIARGATRTAEALCSLLFQLFEIQPRLLRHAIKYWDAQTLSYLAGGVQQIFTAAMSDPEALPICCVLDGIDECDECDECDDTDWLSQAPFGVPKIKFLLFSRAISSRERAFYTAQNIRIEELTPTGAEQQLVGHALRGLLAGVEDHDLKAIGTVLHERAHGNCLWLRVVCQMIEKAAPSSLAELREYVLSLTPTLYDFYEIALAQTPSGLIEERDRLFGIMLVWSHRSTVPGILTVPELWLLIRVLHDPHATTIDELLYPDLDHFKHTIDAEYGAFIRIDGERTVWMHSTVPDFLESRGYRDAVFRRTLVEAYVRFLVLTDFAAPDENLYGKLVLSYPDIFPNAVDTDDTTRTQDLSDYERSIASLFVRAASTWHLAVKDAYLEDKDVLWDQILRLFDAETRPVALWWVAAARRYDLDGKGLAPTAPLHIATIYNFVPVMQRIPLLSSVINEVDERGNTPLITAIRCHSLNSARVLIEAGAKVDPVGTMGRTALHEAASSGQLEVTKLLLDAGAHVNTADHMHASALHAAAGSGHAETVKLLRGAGADVGSTDMHGNTTLHAVAKAGASEVVQLLLNAGADINSTNEWDQTALHRAAEAGALAVVKVLLDAGADVDSIDQFGQTALHVAAEAGKLEAVKRLVDAGADVNRVDGFHHTALHRAAELNRADGVVQFLLDNGADPHIVPNVWKLVRELKAMRPVLEWD